MGIYVGKVTTRGQVTLPQDWREQEKISGQSYVVMREAGEWLLVGKLEQRLDRITGLLEKEARKRKVGKADLLREVERIRAKK